MLFNASTVLAQVSVTDSLALVSLYNNTDGPNWTYGWDLSAPVETWHGVSTSNGRVDSLTLVNNGLSGVLPASMGNLSELRYLNLSLNNLSGELPVNLWNLTNLTDLTLYSNKFTGQLPEELGNLVNLQYLNLYNNQFSGNLPAGIGNFTYVKTINLGYNDFSGTIPESIGNLLQLEFLDVSANNYHGGTGFISPIPQSLGQLSNLSVLKLNSNSFSGPLPECIGSLTDLILLQAENCGFEGPIPDFIGNLTNLTNLNLQRNNFRGRIPESIGNLNSLQYLYLGFNELNGPVPITLTQNSSLIKCYIHHNALTGLPDFSNLVNLTHLLVYENQLTFDDIIPNLNAASTQFSYVPQDSVGSATDTLIKAGQTITLSVNVGGDGNTYQWFKDSVEIAGQDVSTLSILGSDFSDSGIYTCRITNYQVPDLTLWSKKMRVRVMDNSLEADSLALVDLYNATNGPGWSRRDGWLSAPLKDWNGVTVINGRVSDLSLANNGLSGNLPGTMLFLDSLKHMNLSYNSLNGTFPDFIYGLTSLTYLNLSGNGFDGSLKPDIAALTNLEVFNVDGNQLSGEIPAQIADLNFLRELNLTQNQFTGSFPEAIFGMQSLAILAAGANYNLNGTLPAAVADMPNLTQLFLHNCSFNGPLPEHIGPYDKMMVINISGNGFSGPLPATFGNYTKLSTLYLDNNQLDGDIPAELGNVKTLQTLTLGANDFNAQIPDSIWTLSTLKSLNLGDLGLSGPFPQGLTQLTNLTFLTLYKNKLEGDVPQEINHLTKLNYLYLFENRLSGLPALDSLKNLRMLRVQNNKLSFEDIEPNLDIATSKFDYSPQDSTGSRLDTVVAPGASFLLDATVGGTHNLYQWYHNEQVIDGATSPVYERSAVTAEDGGTYVCAITNTVATSLTLYSRAKTITVDNGVGIGEQNETVPQSYALLQNVPNPFNPTTLIVYRLAKAGPVQVDLYNLQGQKVRTLVSTYQVAGTHQVQVDGRGLASGVYVYRLHSGTFSAQRKMLFLK